VTYQTSAFTSIVCLLCLCKGGELLAAENSAATEPKAAVTEKVEPKNNAAVEPADEENASDDPAEAERKEVEAAVALPVSSDPVQIYGWREWVVISDGTSEQKVPAKLDTGALTSSIHAEEKKLFERDGKKWVRFIVTDPRNKDSKRLRVEAPLVRIARIKEPGGESEEREVVRLSFKIGERKMLADFTLNNRVNMLSPILIGRRTICELGWVDPSRAYLADKKLMR
jgi:hypothetical protein